MTDVTPAPDAGGADELMASIRADQGDVAILFEALRDRLTGALGAGASTADLPARRRRPATRSVSVTLGEHVFEASLSQGSLSLFDRQSVRGITLRSDELTLSEWVEALVGALQHEAARSDSTRAALERLLIG